MVRPTLSGLCARVLPVALSVSALAAVALGQDPGPRPLTHDDYAPFERIGSQSLSPDGSHVAYMRMPGQGDRTLMIRSTDGDPNSVYRIERGASPSWSADGRFVLCRIAAGFEAEREYELEKMLREEEKKNGGDDEKKEKLEKPESEWALISVADGAIEMFGDAERASLTSEGLPFLFVYLEASDDDEEEESEEGAGVEEPEEEPSEPEEESNEPEEEDDFEAPDYWQAGQTLVVRDLRDGSEVRIDGVTEFGAIDERAMLWFARNSEEREPEFERGLFARNLETGAEHTLIAGAADQKSFVTDREHTRLAFFSDRNDRDAEESKMDLFVWEFDARPAERVVHRGMPGFPREHRIDASDSPSFSQDGSTLMFGIEEPEAEEPPKLLSDERVVVDLWHWKDDYLQPMQALREGQLSSTTLTWVCHVDDRTIQQVAVHPGESVRFLTPDGSRLQVSDAEAYAREISWDGRYSDFYVVNGFDGRRQKVIERLRGFASSSPGGRYLLSFDGQHWHCHDVVEGTSTNLTHKVDVSFARAEDDRPEPRRAYGVAGWTEGDAQVLLYDRFDVWMMRPDGTQAVCVTDGFGRKKSIEFRVLRLDPDLRSSDPLPASETLMLAATDLDTMESGFYTDRIDGLGRPEKVVMEACRFGRPRRAQDADVLLFTKERFDLFPDLYVAGPDFADPTKLSDGQSQLGEFSWGTAELVTWTNSNGVELKGILRKPHGFDESKQYPLLVYFYEKRSRNLHSFNAPTPSQNPQPSYYVSNGYLFFEPDIVYVDGYPGESCVECVIPGVQSLIAKGYVDREHIGAAGHSWGGYQTAYLATRTDLFAALESGAPVSNMTSAYGGIRWASGMSRAFQYEKTQSRIGGTLWEKPMHYLENSPLFRADDVRTPLIMVHNDNDGAVPWYQGIEFFCALRRLGKEAYMFNYNGSGHGLRRWATRLDYCRRTQQFFDYHLRGQEMPEWMAAGIPHHERIRRNIEFAEPWSVQERARRAESEASEEPAEAVEITVETESGSSQR
ncbi:MAG: prolyl oligopeptidase family serine peptidase [Planctomycetota bacterium]